MKSSAQVDQPASILDRGETQSCQDARRPTLRIIALFETATISGPAKNLFQFCRAARSRSTGPLVDLVIVTFQRSYGQSTEFAEAAKQWEVPLHCIPGGFLFDVRVLGHLRKLKERLRPDLIETHAVKSHALLRASGLWQETPWVAFHHGYTNTSLGSPIYNGFDRWSLRKAAAVVTMNRVFERQLVSQGVSAERITVLHNAVQLPAYHQVRSDALALQLRKKNDLGVSAEHKLILCVGRLSREKAHIDMIAALHHLQQRRPDRTVRLILVGDGPERTRISHAIRSSGLTGNVMFAGQVKDVAPYYEAADVVAIPSLSEGSPNVLLEAMAFGVPVVATSVGGIPEIVRHGETALMVQPRSPGPMAEAIDLLLSNPGTAMNLVQHARSKIEKDHSPESRTQALLDIYTRAYRLTRKPGLRDTTASF